MNRFWQPNGFIQEACTEDPKQQAICILIRTEGSLRKADNKIRNRFLLNGSRLLPLPLRLLNLLSYRGLGSPVDPIHAPNSIQKPSVVEVGFDYGFHA